MKITVLGATGDKCRKMGESAREAAEALKMDASVEMITDAKAIMSRGVMLPPALALDDNVVSTGKMLDTGAIMALIMKYVRDGGCSSCGGCGRC